MKGVVMYDDTMLKEIHRATVEAKLEWWGLGVRDTMPVIGVGFDRHRFITIDLGAFLTMFGHLQATASPAEQERMRAWGIPFAVDTTLTAVATLAGRKSDWAQLAVDCEAGGDLPEPGDRITEVWFSFDGHACMTDEEGLAGLNRGDMEKDFKSNPASEVKEVLTTLVYTEGEDAVEMAAVRTFYAVTDGGVMKFDDPIIGDGDRTSVISQILVRYVGREVTP